MGDYRRMEQHHQTAHKGTMMVREMQCHELGRLMHLVHHEQDPRDRLQALELLRRLFSIRDDSCSLHHLALELHVDRKLSWQLSYDLQSPSIQRPIIAGLCDCLCLLWTGSSPERRQRSFLQLTEFFPWYLQAWKMFGADRSIMHSIIQILCMWSKVKSDKLKRMLIRSDLVQRIRQFLTLTDMAEPFRPAIVSLLKDLTTRSCDSDKEYLYREFHGLVLECCKDGSQAIMETSSSILWNWSILDGLGRAMSQNAETWRVLRKLIALNSDESMLTIRQHASSIVGTVMATWTSTKMTSPPKVLLDQVWLPGRLFDILRSEIDSDIRRRSIRTMRCLVTCTWGRDFFRSNLESPTDVLPVLIDVLRNANDDSDARCQACQAISTLMSYCQTEWGTPDSSLIMALVQIIEFPQTHDKLVLAACQTLSIFIDKCPQEVEKKGFVYSPKLLSRLQQVLDRNTTEAPFHLHCSELFLKLIDVPMDDSTKENERSNVMIGTFPDILSILISSVGPDTVTSRRNAISIILKLLEDEQSKKPLADNERLLTSLVNFCLLNSGPQKDTVKKIILKLVPEI